jgi:peptidoglycan hydrolase-like protein with peptidoglycan-binding domain
MRYREFRIVETKLREAGEVYVIGDSHAKAMGGTNNLASNGARLSAIARQASSVPNGSTVYMTGGHNDVPAGTNPQQIASQVQSIISTLKGNGCTVNYILFPEGSKNNNQEQMGPTRQAISTAVTVSKDLDSCSMQPDGMHCSLGSYRGIVNAGSANNEVSNDDATAVVAQELAAGPPYPAEDIEAVKALQTALQSAGYSVGSTGIDGKYGPRTTAAVRSFKKDYSVDGSGLSIDAAGLDTLSKVVDGSIPKVETPSPTGASAPGGELGQLSQDSVTQGKVGEVLDLIAGPESGGRYDAVYPGRRRPQILDMTIDELVPDMRARGRASGSSASGRYQYIRTTLLDVVGGMGLDTATTKFDPETQDKIAIYHLRRNHGLDNWLEGRMSDGDFLNRLAGTWAGIPQTNGRSRYAGVLDNRAGMGANDALSQLDRIKGLA